MQNWAVPKSQKWARASIMEEFAVWTKPFWKKTIKNKEIAHKEYKIYPISFVEQKIQQKLKQPQKFIIYIMNPV